MPNKDIRMEMYGSLRAEICQSISMQHKIALLGYGLAGTIVGYSFSKEQPNTDVLYVVPLVLVAMTALWTVECNRMIRAGYFIAYHLWEALENPTKQSTEVNWEKWIKSTEDEVAVRFRATQHWLQAWVFVFLPVLFSSLVVGIGYKANTTIAAAFGVLYFVLWGLVWYYFRRVSDLSATAATKK